MPTQPVFAMGFFRNMKKRLYAVDKKRRGTKKDIPIVSSKAATIDVYAPKNFNTILSTNIPTSISVPTVTVTSLTNRSRYVIKTNNTYINISDTYDINFSTTLTTYKNFLTKVFQFIQDESDTSCYRIDSELHSLYSLDYSSSTGKLVFTNNWGNGGSTSLPATNGYLCFAYTSDKKLQVKKRYSYSNTEYTHSADTSFTYANYYVKYSTSGLTLVSSSSQGSTFTIYTSKMNVDIPSDFNPIPTSYVSNDRVAIKNYVSNTRTNIEGTDLENTECKFFPYFYNKNGTTKASDAGYYYANQIKTPGYDASTTGTNYYANLMLTEISSKVSKNTTYKTLRYPTSLYKTFREGALSIVLKSNSIANGEIGMNTTPYVYFTCEKDDSGQYHPFMCMASYSISDKPNRLMDVCKPPGDGAGAGYAEQNVTRDATLQLYLTKIPMLDYGLVSETSISGSVGYIASLTSSSSYYKTGAVMGGSYYGSKTIFTKITEDNTDYLTVISDGDPFPAQAGATNYGNSFSYERSWPLVPNPLTEQIFNYKFVYRGGTNSESSSNFFTSMGIQGIFLNGVSLYNPSSGSGTVPGTTISGQNKYNLNAVFFEDTYGIDEAGGHPSPEGNIVNGKQGQYHYHDAGFLISDSWNNDTFAYSNAYFSSDSYTDGSGNVDYIRHRDGHSKIVGFCFDGYPIYGPYGYSDPLNNSSSAILMTTSYKTRTTPFTGRPYTYNSVVSGTNTITKKTYKYKMSAGAFLDDYIYQSGLGTLDDHNGRFCVTPDYPDGTYAYFVLINSSNEVVFPYIIGQTSKQTRTVTNYGTSGSSGGSTLPTPGEEGVFDVSTLGVSYYSEENVDINEIVETTTNSNDMYSATLAYDFIEHYDENGNDSNGSRIISSLNYNNYNYASISGIGVIIDGVSLYPVLNNTLTTAHKSAEITSTGIHVGQGMGLHYHANGYSAKSTTNNLCLYNDADYTNRYHPPLIGFGLDGIALYGIYRSASSSMHGYSVALDSFGGHSHGSYGYHYHAHTIQNSTTSNIDTITDGSVATTYKIHALMKGAWKGYINDIPDFWDSNHGSHSQYAPEYSLSTKSKYVWGYQRN